jgi:Ca-activated chloride channel homolog
VIALARPVWGVDLNIIETQGVSVMIVLDVSNSMNAQDLVPSRLERARLVIRDLFDGLAGNEIGLILFAGTAFIQFPLTTDTISAQSFLSAVSTDAITLQGTAIEDSLRLAMNTFSAQSPAAQVIVLMTDGEGTEGDALAAADDATEREIVIHSIGFGDPQGAPIPILDEQGQIAGYKSDPDGNVVLSRLDEELLQAIAERTGGLYQRAGAGEAAAIVQAISAAQAGTLDTRTEERGVERFGIFVALAVLALSLEMLLPETRKVTA